MTSEIWVAQIVMFVSLAIVGGLVSRGLWQIFSMAARATRERNRAAESKRALLLLEARTLASKISRSRAIKKTHSRQD